MSIPALLRQLREHFDDPYRFRASFETEEVEEFDDETGEDYAVERLCRVQIVRFQDEDGADYVWYARRHHYDDTAWEIAFGTDKGTDFYTGNTRLGLELTGRGRPFRILATVVAITNYFTEYAAEQAMTLSLESEGAKRTKLYLDRVLPLLDNFKVADVLPDGDTTNVFLTRTRL